ncbi:uncharacterized protein B0T15DRAFT_568435 [Chaetomium strumarium]|uniref:MutL C-terminal dimerisation domain-containing protein n=1 Tax=Chaetomium strumarium TaxID=1170767 RepID=A0AAJ0GRN5_9PEZI|nr:hypothetical protein B0T15DRAFT_568435 [Chaetomium strumarium]
MSMQPLPEDVAAKIKSSAVITSLNGAVCGLLQNSLDAGASKISISVDYSRGNCSVEDNGVGIAPADFREDGGLGRLHYTSKYPPRSGCHGKHGEFLSSLAALSLLSITSHHRDYRTHNSVTIHNSRVIARSLPAPPEQRVLASASGTRVVVRDLFGSMPVRVKQRAAEVERAGTSRDFDQLISNVVALLLPWPGDATVSVLDSYARRTVSLRAPALVGWSGSSARATPDIVSRTTTLLTQASLVDNDGLKCWVPVGATASGISVRGCVSLQPVATKHVQFIALGIKPLLNNHRSNVLYEDVNRIFEKSSFGVVEDAGLDEEGLPSKTEGFTGRELKPKKGIDRWPMFFLQILLTAETEPIDVDEALDENSHSITVIGDLLQVMTYEFLKKYHFRPRLVSAVEKLKRPKNESPVMPSKQHVSSPRPRVQIEPHARRSHSRQEHRVQTSLPRPRSGTSEPRSASPFASWSRVKPNAANNSESKPSNPFPQSSGKLEDGDKVRRDHLTTVSEGNQKAKDPLFGKSGRLLRKPFDDVDEMTTARLAGVPESQPSDGEGAESGQREIVWFDPDTKIKSLIDRHTGFAIKTRSAVDSVPSRSIGGTAVEEISRSCGRTPTRRGEQNTIFQPTEPHIPQALQVSELLGCEHGSRGRESQDVGRSITGVSLLATLEGRVSRVALRSAEIVAQVDQKFILAKVPTRPQTNSANSVTEAEHTLILIDQHAADERCKVEDLLKGYFISGTADDGRFVAQTQSLDKPIRFDLSRRDGELLVRFQQHLEHWGLVYEAFQGQDSLPHGPVTVEIRMLPPSILERCRLEPRLLIDLLRKEIWKLYGMSGWRSGGRSSVITGSEHDWVARFHECPEGILDLIHSRACRTAIMFNDPLTLEQCSDLVQRLAACAFPFQCAHGRPSMVPLVHLSGTNTIASSGIDYQEDAPGELLRVLRRWQKNWGQSG